jgi:multidrug efflux pump subunit AcrB
MFFMGVTNALFVALSVPLSMFIAFMFMPSIGFTLNMIVLFAFLLALGIVVDDAIVVIENTHRIYHTQQKNIKLAAKMAAGEVFLPVLSGTITTLAPFIPLAFWTGIIGKFMFYLPITLIISLLASLFVAYIINPVFAVDFMEKDENHEKQNKFSRGTKITLIVMAGILILFYAAGNFFVANLGLTLLLFYLLNKFFLSNVIHKWQTKTWPAFQNLYTRFLVFVLKRPYTSLFSSLALFVIIAVMFVMSSPKVIFFPDGDPNNIYVYVNLPVGTDPKYTNEIMKKVEKKVYEVIGIDNEIVSSVIVNVTVGVTDPSDQDQSPYPNRGKIAINFVKFADRKGKSTMEYLQKLQGLDWGIPGADIFANKEQNGPPVSKPINIEISGEKFESLVKNAKGLKSFLDSMRVAGVVEIKSDFQENKPEIVFDIDRERANREGISTGQIGMEIRNAVFGAEASKFRDANDEYPIQVRYAYDQRKDIESIRNLKITYRDMNMGGLIRSIPLSSVCNVRYDYSYGGIKRKNNKRVITLASDVKEGFNPNEVVAAVKLAAGAFKSSDDVLISFTGQEEEQKETGDFLGTAMMISIGLILLVLVMQFNSFGKPLIILTEIIFSVFGVLLGVAITGMDMSIVMTGVGVVALAGIVVRNGILLVEFAEMSRAQGMSLWEATVQAGRTRMTPVLLTAMAAILGLIPLAVGLNIDFYSLFSEWNPKIFFGGDSVVFWGPLSWTMIYGLAFATFLTLLLVPAMYIIGERLKRKSEIVLEIIGLPKIVMYVPFLILFLRFILYLRGIKPDYGNLDA